MSYNCSKYKIVYVILCRVFIVLGRIKSWQLYRPGFPLDYRQWDLQTNFSCSLLDTGVCFVLQSIWTSWAHWISTWISVPLSNYNMPVLDISLSQMFQRQLSIRRIPWALRCDLCFIFRVVERDRSTVRLKLMKVVLSDCNW